MCSESSLLYRINSKKIFQRDQVWYSLRTPTRKARRRKQTLVRNGYIQFSRLLHLPNLKSGHYARKSWSTQNYPRPKLLRAADKTKDQSYYLSSISEEGLTRALFPLGDMTKLEVRALAKEHNLPTAERPESMGICFIGEKSRFSDFICAFLFWCTLRHDIYFYFPLSDFSFLSPSKSRTHHQPPE